MQSELDQKFADLGKEREQLDLVRLADLDVSTTLPLREKIWEAQTGRETETECVQRIAADSTCSTRQLTPTGIGVSERSRPVADKTYRDLTHLHQLLR